jgi:subtilisin family serine protease
VSPLARLLAARGALLALALGLTVAAPVPGGAQAAAPDARPGEVIVRLSTASGAGGAVAGRAVVAKSAVAGGEVVRVAVPAGSEDQVARSLGAQPGVAWAAPNHRMRRLAYADPAAEPDRSLGWHLDQVDADRAWAFTRGDPSVKVAIVDSGLDLGHPDRPVRVEIGPTFAARAADVVDRDGHGTHAAGTIAAPVNGRGSVGLAPDVTVQVLKVFDDEGNVYVYDVYRAILWAADNGARIVNLSLGVTQDSPALREAVEYARARGVLVVAAAGNSAEEGNPVVYPAAYPGVLAVGASTRDRRAAPYSETGPYLGLLAPGGLPGDAAGDGVNGPLPNAAYGRLAGTSSAAPLASAAAALVWSTDPSLSADQVRARLLATAVDVAAAGRDDASGAGLLNAGAAVQATAARFPLRVAIRDQSCPTIVAAGGRTALTFDLVNAGGRAWSSVGPNPVLLAPSRPNDRVSAFFTPGTWLSPSRAAPIGAGGAQPGEVARFTAVLSAPAEPGIYREYFRLVADGLGWFNDLGLYCDVTVLPSTAWLAADARVTAPAVLQPGATARVIVQARNVGTETWRRDGPTPFRLGTDGPRDRASALYDPRSWLGPGRIALAEAEVPPGAIGSFGFSIRAPTAEGRYFESFAPVADGLTWLSLPISLPIQVRR